MPTEYYFPGKNQRLRRMIHLKKNYAFLQKNSTDNEIGSFNSKKKKNLLCDIEPHLLFKRQMKFEKHSVRMTQNIPNIV